MPLDTFRQIFLPYCIRLNSDGTYSVLNRERHNLGHAGPTYVPGTEPSVYSLKGIGPKALDKIAHSKSGDDEWYLYDDSTLPDSSPENWAAYSDRLWALRKFEKKRWAPGEHRR
jgi:hypothetical protein